MSEASQLESMLQGEVKEPFDLVKVASGCVDGYCFAYPDSKFFFETCDARVMLYGLPDTMAQLLDKLVQNAIDFATVGSIIVVAVSGTAKYATLSVMNRGPTLTPETQLSLFSSMVSSRTDGTINGTHLGLGLYIVRLIAEFHGGTVSASNLEGNDGVQIKVRLPRA